jgi:geranylgeranyl diphosphate synthase type II
MGDHEVASSQAASQATYPGRLIELKTQIDQGLATAMTELAPSVPEELLQAMRYSLLAGGKRVRPALTLLFAEAAGGAGAARRALPVALALECVHVYSLIHDDLPAMDDDDLRRGQPSCHKRFGEGLAVLAGDALLTHAFELAGPCAAALARAAGPRGMVGGQVLDLRGEGRTERSPERGESSLEAIHRGKTAALIQAACVCGVACGGGDKALQQAATRYGEAIGLCFQVVDDILDTTQSSATLGKTAGKDADAGKQTYPSLLGLRGARERAQALTDRALAALEALPAGEARESLAALARFIRDRDR